MTIWLTADWHLDHENIIGYTGRHYRSAHEMNAALLANALAVVRPTDTLYVLGDFAFNRQTFASYAASLRAACSVVFLRGNHVAKQETTCGLAAVFKHNKRHYYLCHYPWASWRPNTVMLHGHCHGQPVPLPGDLRQHMRYDVGVDSDWTPWGCHRYYPVSIETVEARIGE